MVRRNIIALFAIIGSAFGCNSASGGAAESCKVGSECASGACQDGHCVPENSGGASGVGGGAGSGGSTGGAAGNAPRGHRGAPGGPPRGSTHLAPQHPPKERSPAGPRSPRAEH